MPEKNIEDKLRTIVSKVNFEPQLRALITITDPSSNKEMGDRHFEYLFRTASIKESFYFQSEIADLLGDREFDTEEELGNAFAGKFLQYMMLNDSIRSLLNAKAYKEILDLYKKNEEKNKFNETNNPYHRLILGLINLKLGNIEEAEYELEKAAGLDPNEIDVQNMLGIVYRERDQLQKAENILKKALETEPKKRKDIFDVFEEFYKSKGIDKELNKPFKKVSAIKSDIFTNLSSCYFEQERYDEAEEAAKKSLVLNLDQVAAKINLAKIYHKQKKYDKAETYFREITGFSSNDVEFLIDFAICLRENKKYLESADQLERAVEIAPDNTDLKKSLKGLFRSTSIIVAKKYFDEGNYIKAEEFAKKALAVKEEKEDSYDYGLLGDIYEKQNRIEEAAEAYRKAIKLDPGRINYYMDLGMNRNRYMFNEVMGKNINLLLRAGYPFIDGLTKKEWDAKVDHVLEEAEECFEKAIEIDSSFDFPFISLETCHSIHYTYSRKKKFLRKSEEVLKRGIELHPNNAELYDSLARVYNRQNKYRKSKAAYEKAVELGSTDAKEGLAELEKETSWFRKILPW